MTKDLVYKMVLNWSGRYLLLPAAEGGTAGRIPLSVWPAVLERVGHSGKHDYIYQNNQLIVSGTEIEASVIYTLLQGPALLYRAYGHNTEN